MSTQEAKAVATPAGFSPEYVKNASSMMNTVLANVFALYIKTKNFHWHMSGPHFRDYHLLLDEQGTQIFGMSDDVAERVRKIGGVTIRSIGQIARMQHIADNDETFVNPKDMLLELYADNRTLLESLRTMRQTVPTTWAQQHCLRSGLTKPSAEPGS